MKISTTVNKFIASNGNFDAREIVRHQFFIYLALTNITVSLVLIVLIGVFQPDIFIGLQLLIGIFCFSTAGLWLYKNNGTLKNCNNLLLIGLFFAGLGASLAFLNAYGVTTYYYLGIPILAYFIAGSKSGATWTTITVIVALTVLVLKQHVINLDLGIEGFSSRNAYFIERGIYLGSMLIIGSCCYLYTYLYYRERKILLKQQAKLLNIIDYDELTGIYNYKKISQLIGDIIDEDQKNNQKFAYSLIGMDNFKMLNDEYGYQFGDKILKALAHRLKKTLSENEILARLNGTHFALLTMHSDSSIQTQKNIEKLLAKAWGKIEIAGKQIEIISSVGTAIYPVDGTSLKELTNNADRKMLNRD